MTSLLRWSLTAASGACTVLALVSFVTWLRSDRTAVRGALVVVAACVAVYAYAALGVYRSNTIEAYISATRFHASLTVLAHLALLWWAALCTRLLPGYVPWLATGLAATVVVSNVLSPNTLAFVDVLELQGVLLPWGEVAAQAVVIPSKWSHTAGLLTIGFYGITAFAWWRHTGDGEKHVAISVTGGLAVLLATMVVELLDPRVVPLLPAEELGLFALTMVLPLATRSGPTIR